MNPSVLKAIHEAADSEWLIRAVMRLLAIPSPTGEAGRAADCLAKQLSEEGFTVERPAAGHPAAPAVVVRWSSGQPGPTLQFDGHLDTVHLPFIAPRQEGELIHGSGASDMKAGVIAAVEGLRIIRRTGLMKRGSILLTFHDLHEAPWGLGEQLDQLIREGCVGDAVLIPESHRSIIHIIGRGAATWKVHLRRSGLPVHEVMRPKEEPSVIAAGADLVQCLNALQTELSQISDPMAGSASVFVGQIHSGEIYNQYPQECWLEGTRRWLPGTNADEVQTHFRQLIDEVARRHRLSAELIYKRVRGAFKLDPAVPFVSTFQAAHRALGGNELPYGAKAFVDDGNSFSALANCPAITHGPEAGGQHTVSEWVSIPDLIRVAKLYALCAIEIAETTPERSPRP